MVPPVPTPPPWRALSAAWGKKKQLTEMEKQVKPVREVSNFYSGFLNTCFFLTVYYISDRF